MASAIYIICHDGIGRSCSLITQLGLRDNLQCITTASKVVPGNLVTMPLMLGLRVGEGAGFVPRFLMRDVTTFNWIDFEEWWEQPVYSQGEDDIITRSELVRAVRSKDGGGGHYDAELTCKDYLKLKHGGGWKLVSDDGAGI